MLRESSLQHGMHIIGSTQSAQLKNSIKDVGTIVSLGLEYSRHFTAAIAREIPSNVVIIEAIPGAFPDNFRKTISARKNIVFRLDTKVSLAAEFNLVINTSKSAKLTGTSEISGIGIVSGGYIGSRGSIVVDSFEHPTKIIGIADGRGGLLKKRQELRHIRKKIKLQKFLIDNLYVKEH